jgi:hypothetical protein
MTTLLFLMGFLVLAVAALGLGLWQMVRLRRHGRRAAPLELLAPLAPARSYGPMARLFDGRDLEFLKSQNGCRPGMTTRLRLERRAVLSLYLRQVHGDFRQCFAYCRVMAPVSDGQEVALAVMRQFFVFYGLYAALQLHCLLGLLVYVRPDVGGLLAVVQRLQQRAQRALGERQAGLPAATAR